MILKNNTARLITLNIVTGSKKDKKSEKIDIMPAGEPVKVSKAIADSAYCKALIADGQLSEVASGKAAPVVAAPAGSPTDIV